MTVCSNCGSENSAGRKFCGGCGAVLARNCPACGAANEPGMRFCGECGTALEAQPAPAEEPVAARETPASERRLVSVLFADLVGFTTLSESRDPEEVRELLGRYFDSCRRLISLYGGTVEKFIGDAVMAVWGTPTATEDDAERAVRAALDLIAAVSALGEEIGAPELRARAGVLTGEAAVTLAAEGEGMVAGDLVNTASRIQSVAEAGAVLVGESTRRATEAAIVYEQAGARELKGKAEPVPLWRAHRVVSGRQGALKSAGLEAPFVGRERELRQIKDLFHACADENKAHLVSVTGIAGIGKSRLGWEFYKYFDGIAGNVYWHRGRCLSYGEGVTYWALADMIRMRCRISEDEEASSALGKLRATLDEHLLDPGERDHVEPRLAQLLGLAEQGTGDKQDLFAAWRLFFERLAETYPTVLVFEDVQWADASLLDFVEYLLEWSRSRPLFVLTLARPELSERRPTWGAGHRNFSSLYLEPLSRGVMSELLTGLVPGLPEDVRNQILDRAEGVPLYAVETVRMLLDRGLLVEEGSVYRPAGEIGSLEVPETLHALIAARLDGLSPDERRLLEDGAVLGRTFAKAGLAALSGLAEMELDPLLSSLVRKEVLGVQADPRSPEHGQYGFLQDLIRHVAYETLSKRERRSRHLAAAAHLEASFPEDEEIVEVVASHYLDAYGAVPDADDAQAVKAKARGSLLRAGERAQSLGASGEAQRYLEQAAGLTDENSARAALLDRAGWLAYYAGDLGAGPACSASRSSSSMRRATRMPRHASRAASPRSKAGRGGSTRRSFARSEPSRSSLPTSRTRTSRSSPHCWPRATPFREMRRGPGRRSVARSTWPRRSAHRGSSCGRSRSSRSFPWVGGGRRRRSRCSSTRPRSHGSTSSSSLRSTRTSTSRRPGSNEIGTPIPSNTWARLSSSHAASARARRSGRRSRRRPTRSTWVGAGTRRSRRRAGFPRTGSGPRSRSACCRRCCRFTSTAASSPRRVAFSRSMPISSTPRTCRTARRTWSRRHRSTVSRGGLARRSPRASRASSSPDRSRGLATRP